MLRILLVENDKMREEVFSSWLPENEKIVLRMIPYGNIAMTILEKDQPGDWHGVMLDHDLDVFSPEVPYRSGSDVVKVLANKIDPRVPVFIHSMNPSGAAHMQTVLEGSGFDSVTRVPFFDMGKEDLLDWLEEVEDAKDVLSA